MSIEHPKLQLPLDDQDAITCENLHHLVLGAHRLRRNLELISHDIALLRAQKELIFAIDFSDLYTYLWPDKSASYGRGITRFLLRHEQIKFTLTPGSTVELIWHLKRFISSKDLEKLKLDRFFRNEIVGALLEQFDRGAGEKLHALVSGLPQVENAMEGIRKWSGLLERLGELLDRPNFVPFSSFFDNTEPLPVADARIMRSCLSSLNYNRPGATDSQNFIDAHNYALLWAMSNAHFLSRERLYLLVTSSPIPHYVFRQHRWDRFPDTLRDPDSPDFSLVRHPIQALYLTQMLKQEPGSRHEVSKMVRELKYLVMTWRNDGVYTKFLAKKASPTDTICLPRSVKYIKTYLGFRARYTRLFEPVRAAIESELIAEENTRRLRLISPLAVGTAILGEFDGAKQLSPRRLVYMLFDRLTRITLQTISKFSGLLGRLPRELIEEVDVEGIVYASHRLQESIHVNMEYECTEFSIMRSGAGEAIISGDAFCDYYAIWWPTSATFDEFIRETGHCIAALRERIADESQGVTQAKEFAGIYLYFSDSCEPLTLRVEDYPELSPDEILAEAKMRPIDMVRVATDVGDFCYDFRSFNGMPQRAGIVSHLKCGDSVAWFIYGTHVASFGRVQLSEILRRRFAAIK